MNACTVYIVLRVRQVFREFERLTTALMNAAVGPLVASYVDSLEKRLGEAGLASATLHVMGSSGGRATPAMVRQKPVLTSSPRRRRLR